MPNHTVKILCPDVPNKLRLQGLSREKSTGAGERRVQINDAAPVFIALGALDTDQVEEIIKEWGVKLRRAHEADKQNVKKDGDFL